MIEIGDRVKDAITGYVGIVIGVSKWITGCITYGVKAERLDKDGKDMEAVWFDENRLVLVKRGAIKIGNVGKVRPSRNGGPHSETPRQAYG